MFTDLDMPNGINETEEMNTGLQDAENESAVIFPDEETIEKELEHYRLQQICRKFPDHCIQLCFLS